MKLLAETDKKLEFLERKLERERRARNEAERLLEKKSLELYNINLELRKINENLDQLVADRTYELQIAINQATQNAADLRLSLDRLQLVLQAANAIIWDWDVGADRFEISGKLSLPVGVQSKSIHDFRNFIEHVHEDDRSLVERTFKTQISKRESLSVQCRLLSDNDEYRWHNVIGKGIQDERLSTVRVVGAIIDIHARIENERIINRMAHYDVLTNIPNRTYFNNSFNQFLERADEEESHFALLLIDLNDFKLINDTYGHVAGDKLLAHVASQLNAQTKGYDIVARLGGDEFAVILNNLPPDMSMDDFCNRIIDACIRPIDVGGDLIQASLSIGMARYPDHGETREKLLRCADVAMYHAKSNSLQQSAFAEYNPHLDESRRRRKIMKQEIEAALIAGEFQLAFQPYIDLSRDTLRGGEALLRWNRNDNQPVNIQEIINLAEESRLILDIGRWVIFETAKFIKRLQELNIDHKIAINLSVVQFKQQDLVAIFREAIQLYGIPPECIQVEVTESLFLDDIDRAARILNSLADMGIEVSVDDFGTGYSSLRYLQRLPVKWVKIDKTFVDGLESKHENLQIVRAIIDMAHSMSQGVVAEGIETSSQRHILKTYGCDVGQGYLFSKPLFEKEYLEFIDRYGS
ncbi:EAL domain-containing protein [Gammaproteobacteria bacterium LSUCC0112]|nr:EAL domain-containing protein [Gammaproteobacteria bacterium LSUCC0112]